MSYTTAYKLWPGERHEDLEEMRNGHGSAPVVWRNMFKRFVDSSGPHSDAAYMFRTEELWPLWKRQDIPAQLRAVLMLTFDNCYVSRDNYARAAADIRAFLAFFENDQTYVNHWPRIAEIFESAPECPALGFRWTSVCEDPFQGPYNEEKDDYDPLDWSGKWELYAEFDATQGDPHGPSPKD